MILRVHEICHGGITPQEMVKTQQIWHNHQDRVVVLLSLLCVCLFGTTCVIQLSDWSDSVYTSSVYILSSMPLLSRSHLHKVSLFSILTSSLVNSFSLISCSIKSILPTEVGFRTVNFFIVLPDYCHQVSLHLWTLVCDCVWFSIIDQAKSPQHQKI